MLFFEPPPNPWKAGRFQSVGGPARSVWPAVKTDGQWPALKMGRSVVAVGVAVTAAPDRACGKPVSDQLRKPVRKRRPELRIPRKPFLRVLDKPLLEDAVDGRLLFGRKLGRVVQLFRKPVRKLRPELKSMRKPFLRLVR